jgi:acetyl esterase/lipase
VGFVSALTGHRYHDRPKKEWFISELQECLATSTHDVQMVLNYLEERGDFDLDRVGMFGQGSGGSIAIMASAADARIKVLDVLDPWGDWPVWMAKSPFIQQNERPMYVAPDFLKKASALEPIDWLPKIQARKFRFQDAVFEVKTPKAAKEKLWAAAPAGTRFVFYNTQAEFDSVFQNSVNQDWMEHELRMLPDATTHSVSRLPLLSVRRK